MALVKEVKEAKTRRGLKTSKTTAKAAAGSVSLEEGAMSGKRDRKSEGDQHASQSLRGAAG